MAEFVREKVFEHFLVFSTDVRMVVINEMEPDDRCRFTRCSKMSQKEAQKCKKYIYGMRFEVYSQNNIIFSVIYHKNHRKNINGDYNVRFTLAHDGNKYIVYSDRYRDEMWRSKLDNSTDLLQYARENVKYMLNMYQNKIKNLWIRNTDNYDFEIQRLSKLESLTIGCETDIRQLMSKIRQPLKEFVCYKSISEIFTSESEQIYKVQDFFKVDIPLNYEQFQKLTARKMSLDIGILTEENVSDFIQSWQNDKLRKNFKSCRWSIRRSTFDIERLLRLLGINHNFRDRRIGRWTKFNIKHNTDTSKKAKLVFRFYKLVFRVLNQ